MNISFVWRDKWIGLYHETTDGMTDWYVCIIPCFPIHWRTVGRA